MPEAAVSCRPERSSQVLYEEKTISLGDMLLSARCNACDAGTLLSEPRTLRTSYRSRYTSSVATTTAGQTTSNVLNQHLKLAMPSRTSVQ